MAAEGDEDAAARLAGMVTEMPALDARWLWLWEAWQALQPSRPYVGIGMGGIASLPLPWGVVEEYAQRRGMAEREGEMLHQVIRALDRLQVKHDRAEAKRVAEGQA